MEVLNKAEFERNTKLLENRAQDPGVDVGVFASMMRAETAVYGSTPEMYAEHADKMGLGVDRIFAGMRVCGLPPELACSVLHDLAARVAALYEIARIHEILRASGQHNDFRCVASAYNSLICVKARELGLVGERGRAFREEAYDADWITETHGGFESAVEAVTRMLARINERTDEYLSRGRK